MRTQAEQRSACTTTLTRYAAKSNTTNLPGTDITYGVVAGYEVGTDIIAYGGTGATANCRLEVPAHDRDVICSA
eukprot:666261-Rhodomonas_salina.2